MAFQITGKLELVGETIARTPKNGGQPFYRREFVLDCTRYNPDTGEPWENHPKFELGGNNCALIDQFEIGQKVTVDFSLKGAKYPDQQTGEIKYFTTINAFKIVLAQQQQQQNGYQPGTAPTNQQPAQQPQYAPQPAQQPFPPQVDENGMPVDNPDDLPF